MGTGRLTCAVQVDALYHRDSVAEAEADHQPILEDLLRRLASC